MISEEELIKQVRQDLQFSGGSRVLYLEGKSDPDIFFAALGVDRPSDDVYKGVLVKGCQGSDRASGNDFVRRIVRVASEWKFRGVWGLVDGDGLALSELAAQFDAPYAGPLFAWKAYSIENLLAKSAWPEEWGEAPNWATVLCDYGVYVALNDVFRELKGALETLGLHRYTGPHLNETLRRSDDVLAALERDKTLIAGRDVAAMFRAALAAHQTAVTASVEEGHARVNGKWLVDVYAVERSGLNVQNTRTRWCKAVKDAGGLTEVRELWARSAGS